MSLFITLISINKKACLTMTVSGLNIETLPVSDVMCPCLMQMSPIIHFVDPCVTWPLLYDSRTCGRYWDTQCLRITLILSDYSFSSAMVTVKTTTPHTTSQCHQTPCFVIVVIKYCAFKAWKHKKGKQINPSIPILSVEVWHFLKYMWNICFVAEG